MSTVELMENESPATETLVWLFFESQIKEALGLEQTPPPVTRPLSSKISNHPEVKLSLLLLLLLMVPVMVSVVTDPGEIAPLKLSVSPI
jgi:hypothetical protein